MKTITAADLRNWVTYCESTGDFIWTGALKRTKAGSLPGCKDGEGYRVMKIKGRMYKAHRLAWLYVNGEWPMGEIDHIDGQRSNNAIGNLRDCTTKENLRARRFSRNPSGYRGVHRMSSGKFRVRLWLDGENKHFGNFEDAELAGLVAYEARLKHYGEFSGGP